MITLSRLRPSSTVRHGSCVPITRQRFSGTTTLNLKLLPRSKASEPTVISFRRHIQNCRPSLSNPRMTGIDGNDHSGTAEVRTVNTTERLERLRALMKDNEVDVYVVVSEDQHSSEYLAECDARRAFISGFDGSAGCAVITTTGAFMFTDGRYFLQAGQQLDGNWTLMKQGLPGVPTWQEFLAKKIPKGSKIGIDPALISISDTTSLRTTLTPRNSSLVPIAENLVDKVWTSRPPRPANPIHPLPLEYAGASASEKLGILRAKLARAGATGVVVCLLDEVAWLVGMRGADIAYNPVFFAYAVVTPNRASLFINSSQLTPEAQASLKEAGWETEKYEDIITRLKELGSEVKDQVDEEKEAEDEDGDEAQTTKGEAQGKVLIDPKASFAVAHALGDGKYHIVRSSVADAKSIKNAVELEGFRNSHIRDGIALARYFAHLEEHLSSPEQPKWTEYEGAQVLERYRSELDLFKGLSFTTISSTGPNGGANPQAVIHYSPPKRGSAEIKKEQMYLCDSGAQFLDGTTDVTRTWHFGTPTEEEKRAFTRVVQGHIAIDTAVFPTGTTGYLLDAFARRALWADGLDYRHGTGHGVGHYLCVHEGPQGIGTRIAYNNTKLKEGMVLSNEPGYYEDGKFGIRIESIVLVRKAETPNDFGSRGYLGFEHVTMSPIHTKLIDVSLLTKTEREWLNAYHKEVLNKVGPELAKIGDARAKAWLEKECRAI
ncbi:X-Pro aminopeptidase [Ceratobasidium theobromae]|uniref:X-Pro aminopeptidase n=1 Tax=Ceratobasidium theobromae TaxID=1582974 RepID=A0A5N5QHR6_9AGAM|nr:X-Pro aminopeptidase [Ceratobasidium theobromae]